MKIVDCCTFVNDAGRRIYAFHISFGVSEWFLGFDPGFEEAMTHTMKIKPPITFYKIIESMTHGKN